MKLQLRSYEIGLHAVRVAHGAAEGDVSKGQQRAAVDDPQIVIAKVLLRLQPYLYPPTFDPHPRGAECCRVVDRHDAVPAVRFQLRAINDHSVWLPSPAACRAATQP